LQKIIADVIIPLSEPRYNVREHGLRFREGRGYILQKDSTIVLIKDYLNSVCSDSLGNIDAHGRNSFYFFETNKGRAGFKFESDCVPRYSKNCPFEVWDKVENIIAKEEKAGARVSIPQEVRRRMKIRLVKK